MTIFKTFLKVLNRCKGTVILYTAILVFFGAFNSKTGDANDSFVASKPTVSIVNEDKDGVLARNLISYMEKLGTRVEYDGEEAIDDSLFYRQVDYVIYVPEDFSQAILEGKSPRLEVKTTESYQGSYGKLLLERYVRTATAYAKRERSMGRTVDPEELVRQLNETLAREAEVEVTSKLDQEQLFGAAVYFNFMNYGLLAGAIFTICMVLSSFREEKVRRRILVSSTGTLRHNGILFLGNLLFAIVLWAFYVVIGFALNGFDLATTRHGLVFLVNSFAFTLCAVSLALLLSSLLKGKDALNGVINVIALGSSFLCGAFVPVEWLPKGVLAVARLLPSYWFINTNERVKTLETWDWSSVRPLAFNLCMVLAFTAVFFLLSSLCSRRGGREG